MKQDAPLIDLQSDEAEEFRVTPGFIAFLAMLFLPILAGIVIYVGAWAVADDVYAADASTAGASQPTAPAANTTPNGDVAGWKRTLVGVCPLH
jgi:hypothetical protein